MSQRYHAHECGSQLAVAALVCFLGVSGEAHCSDKTDAIVIDEKGNVGVGTAQPGAKLDVTGEVHVGGNLTAEGIVDAESFEGDGTSLTVSGQPSLGTALNKKLDKAGGEITGSLTVGQVVGLAPWLKAQAGGIFDGNNMPK